MPRRYRFQCSDLIALFRFCAMTSFANQTTLYVLVFLLATLARAYYITDLKLVSCDATVFACPKFPGYRQIPVNLNAGTSLPSVFLHLKEDLAADPITDIQILRGNETPKPSNVWTRLDTNLNEGSSTEDSSLWLYYTKNTSVSRNPISSIIVKTGSHPEVAAEYRRVPVNLNEGVGGQAMYIYYSQDGPKGCCFQRAMPKTQSSHLLLLLLQILSRQSRPNHV